MINIYEVNRKEGARILMEVHRWLSIGTFRPEGDREATGIVLQNCLIEVGFYITMRERSCDNFFPGCPLPALPPPTSDAQTHVPCRSHQRTV